MHRGILSVIYARLTQSLATQAVLQIFQEAYAREPFVKILPEGKFPKTKEVTGSNRALIGAHVDSRTGYLIVITAIDNLVKGAAGQAIQNMNLMCRFPEETALSGTL